MKKKKNNAIKFPAKQQEIYCFLFVKKKAEYHELQVVITQVVCIRHICLVSIKWIKVFIRSLIRLVILRLITNKTKVFIFIIHKFIARQVAHFIIGYMANPRLQEPHKVIAITE